ncbi:P-loop containing nucleoside triphosphate hydrolase protein [Xylariaceae sp. FL0804]|nr:P-loop containing nucleoside triphosphate hydrolase protein [Xylariaceae sp. FL0804]
MPPRPKSVERGVPWFGRLPNVQVPGLLTPPGTYSAQTLQLDDVVGAIQKGESVEQVRKHLKYYHNIDGNTLKVTINGTVKAVPAMFYIVATNNPEMIRQWVRYGGDVNVTLGQDNVPLLAFAIIYHRAENRLAATETVETLLALGASSEVIPSAFYNPFNRELPASGPKDQELSDIATDSNRWWCSKHYRGPLAASLNLTQRYRLYQARGTQAASGRQRIVAARKGAEPLLTLHQSIIGQSIAVRLLKSNLLANIALSSEVPLVLIFAGPSGHGKTELARKLGEVLSLESISIDCTTFTREDELFGPRAPYYGSDAGSSLNNFLSRMSGQRSIVFMDEFEKTTEAIHNSLLVVFDEGKYRDRRKQNSSAVDCSRTIWILATNRFDQMIHEFCTTHVNTLPKLSKPEQDRVIDPLLRSLRKECEGHFGRPLTGRISAILPFLTFTPDEQAVVAHKYLMELEKRIQRPIVLPEAHGEENMVGNMRLDIMNESATCSSIAEQGYSAQLGARSISRAVRETCTIPLVDEYLQLGDDLSEDQEKLLAKVSVDVDKSIVVRLMPVKDGSTVGDP